MCTEYAYRTEQIFISNRKEIVYVRTEFYQYTPPSSIRTLYGKLLTLYMMYFFPVPQMILRSVDAWTYN